MRTAVAAGDGKIQTEEAWDAGRAPRPSIQCLQSTVSQTPLAERPTWGLLHNTGYWGPAVLSGVIQGLRFENLETPEFPFQL